MQRMDNTGSVFASVYIMPITQINGNGLGVYVCNDWTWQQAGNPIEKKTQRRIACTVSLLICIDYIQNICLQFSPMENLIDI